MFKKRMFKKLPVDPFLRLLSPRNSLPEQGNSHVGSGVCCRVFDSLSPLQALFRRAPWCREGKHPTSFSSCLPPALPGLPAPRCRS